MVKRILGIGLALTFCGLAAAGCAKGDSGNKRTPVVLPDYESMQSEPLTLSGWVPPEATTEAYRDYKEAGFNYVFVGAIGSAETDKVLDAYSFQTYRRRLIHCPQRKPKKIG